ncbi:MAG TPA: sigma-70 family RNA polymerase sigma factor [Gemmataceae bacterium]|nr:sigma-70 family RNA polymerase sigma factor [Gemmataceae bacterium]
MGLNANTIVQVLLRERIKLSASVLAILRDVHGTDDVFQQVVLQALESAEHFREPEHLLAWALRAARHRAIDVLSKRGARCLDQAVLEQLEQQWVAGRSEDLSSRLDALQHCLQKLPERARQLVRLRYEEGLSCTAVAQEVHRSVDAIYQNLSRIHRQLRQCIERELGIADRPPLGETLS